MNTFLVFLFYGVVISVFTYLGYYLSELLFKTSKDIGALIGGLIGLIVCGVLLIWSGEKISNMNLSAFGVFMFYGLVIALLSFFGYYMLKSSKTIGAVAGGIIGVILCILLWVYFGKALVAKM